MYCDSELKTKYSVVLMLLPPHALSDGHISFICHDNNNCTQVCVKIGYCDFDICSYLGEFFFFGGGGGYIQDSHK
jgi:hypothetical protein